MNKYKSKMFFAPDDGGGEGGGGDAIASSGGEVSHGAAAFDIPKTTTHEPDLPVTSDGGEHAEGMPTVPSTSGFDASKFAKEFGDTLGSTLKPILEQSRASAEPPMTPEQARKILNIWEPDDEWYKKYDNLETRAQAVAEMRDGLVKQADTIAQFRMREMVDALRQEVMPHLTSSTQMVNQQREERFKGQYPQLGEPALQPLIKAVAQDLVDRKQTFPNESEMFKALASGVEAVLKVNNPSFKLETTTSNNGSTTTGRSGRSLPVTTPGGGGGTGRRDGGAKVDKPRGMAIFDKL